MTVLGDAKPKIVIKGVNLTGLSLVGTLKLKREVEWILVS
jgi:hypothetical protein